MKLVLRDIVTPAAGSLFLAIAISGVALFFHWSPGLFHTAHEWLGLPFAGLALWHAARHWRSLASYATRPRALSVVAVIGAAAMTVMIVASSDHDTPRAIIHALGRAPLGIAATAFGVPPQQAVQALRAKGITANETQTVAEIARAAGVPPMDILMTLTHRGH